jgi:surface antigen
MKLKNILSIACLAIFLSSCLGQNFANKKTIAHKIYIPSKYSKHDNKPKSMGGKLAGLSIINSADIQLDKHDKEYITRSSQSALNNAKAGETTQWRNPDSGSHGSFKVMTDINAEGKVECRKYNQTVCVNGKTKQLSGKACRTPGGSWLTYL